MMTTNQIRQKFLDFFKSKKHTIVASDSVVPKDDPTVLFTTAGMQQFKRQFLGHIDGFTRAVTSQKCLRTDDLDKIGKTPCHHTFFEMLGNFSFGDYFKEDAIKWAWEFLTQELKLSKEKLWVSVYQDDDEAYNIWLKSIKISSEKIVRLGDKDNFWPAEAKEKGPNGPCGPCSEIFFDYGVNPNCKSKKCDPSCNCGRFTEIWNLVFTQFNRKDGGVLEPLPGKNIDTGMGLERLVSVVQGKKSNYEIDIFESINKAISEKINIGGNFSETEVHIIADHIRAICFGIADGVIPSNEGRGYVIKRLIIDITDIGLKTAVPEVKIYQLVPAVAEAMGKAYPEIVKQSSSIASMIRQVEEAYIKTKKERVPEFKKELEEIKKKYPVNQQIGMFGKAMFVARDTFGLTHSTIRMTMMAANITLEEQINADVIFQKLMEEQQAKSRAASKMTGDRFVDMDLNLNIPKTKFLGYEELKVKAKILKLVRDGKEVGDAKNGDTIKIILDQTPFYAEAGGQIGDTGKLVNAQGTIEIKDTQKLDDVYIHSGIVEKGTIKKDDTVEATIDVERRKAIMKNHTATHLLQAALRKILGSHVQQQGSLVAEDRLRFDFTQPRPITADEILSIEKQVNEVISKNIKIDVEKLKLEEAKKKGALAFFAEKYGQEVRVISIGDYSKEFCGGTHCKNTSEIEVFKIVSQGAVAQGIRRIEAKTGTGARSFVKQKEKEQTQRENLDKLKVQEAEEEKRRTADIIARIPEDLKLSPVINGTVVYTKMFDQIDVNNLKGITDVVKRNAKSSAAVVGSSGTVVIAVTDDLVNKGIRANDLIKEISSLMEGSGGGRPQIAQAGTKAIEKVSPTVKQAGEIIKKKLQS